MINAKKSWRTSEEKKLVDFVNEFLKRGEDIDIAFEAAATELGRTPRGCKDRWNLLYKNRKLNVAAKQIPKTHDYSKLFNDFTAAYGEMEKTIADLINENEHLKARVAHLESVESIFQEASKLFKTAM